LRLIIQLPGHDGRVVPVGKPGERVDTPRDVADPGPVVPLRARVVEEKPGLVPTPVPCPHLLGAAGVGPEILEGAETLTKDIGGGLSAALAATGAANNANTNTANARMRIPASRSPFFARCQPTFIGPPDYSVSRVQTAQKSYPIWLRTPINHSL
jgi:hypothetical protein